MAKSGTPGPGLTPEQAKLVQQGCAIARSWVRCDEEGYTILVGDLMPDVSHWADASVSSAIAVASMFHPLWNTDVCETLQRLTPTSVEIIPGVEVNWSAAVDIVAAVATGDPEVQNICARVDLPTAVQSAFSITVGGAHQLGVLTGKTAEEWLTILATGAARKAEGL